MSAPDTAFLIRRILLALDASPGSLAALDAAVDLAATMEAELSGVFVEDVDLMRMAESPCARQILYPSATQAKISRASMEREMRAQCERARKALAAAAKRAHLPWSFQTVRGQVAKALLNAACEGDILALGRISWSFPTEERLGSTAFELAAGRLPLLLLSKRAAGAGVTLAVYYDDSPDARRALLTAAGLAGGGKGVVVLLAADAANTDALRSTAERLLHGKGLAVRFRRIDPGNERSVLAAMKAEKAGMLVLASRGSFRQPDALQRLLREIEAPVLLLGDGLQPEAAGAANLVS